MVSNNKKLLYNTVLSQTISSCGNFLFIGNNFGDIFTLSLDRISNNDDYNPKDPAFRVTAPISIFSVNPKAPVNSLAFHGNFLIVGLVRVIVGYTWDENKQQIGKKSWEVKLPSTDESIDALDVNFLHLDDSTSTLFAGCGDNLVHQIDLDNGNVTRSFKGHKDYIHSVTGVDRQLYSASEDGTILFWDVREEKQVGCLTPYENMELARPEFGKWQGTVSVTKDWLVCGGGPKASMWHLRSLECTNVLPFPEKVHCSAFLDDLILIAGEASCLHQYSFNAEIAAEVPISGASAYSVAFQHEPMKFLSVGGASNCLDIYTNFNYRDMVIKLYDLNRDG